MYKFIQFLADQLHWLYLTKNPLNYHPDFHREKSYNVRLGKKGIDNINRIENQLENLPKELQLYENNLKHLYQQVENARIELKKPFPMEDELSEKDARLIELNSILDMDANHDKNEKDQPAA